MSTSLRTTLQPTARNIGTTPGRFVVSYPSDISRLAASSGLWLHLHLPQLALEVLTRGSATPGACVLTVGAGSRSKIVMTNARAAALGIRAGMPLAAAHALGELTALERDERAEQQALDKLGLWAMQFSPWISPVTPDGLVLEIKGSLKLFHGVEGLLSRLRQGLKHLGYRVHYAVAPTPLAAGVLARAAGRAMVLEHTALAPQISGLPLAALRLPQAQQMALESIGIKHIGDCRRLPRSGLARRFSPALVDLLDRLYGESADPRPAMVLPARFDAAVELPWEVSHAPALVTAGARLLHELVGYLRAQAASTRRLHWRLVERDNRCERFVLGLARAGRDHAHMLLLLKETLMRMNLQAPVCRIELSVEDIEQGAVGGTGDLFRARPEEQQEAYATFVDRLRSRCGDQALRSLGLVSDHRPEHAWCWQRVEPAQPAKNLSSSQLQARGAARPLWLVKRPLTLPTRNGYPQFEGPLQLVPERERIDTGWWDESATARDYFVAKTVSGSRLWIYKELDGECRWRLQGVFE